MKTEQFIGSWAKARLLIAVSILITVINVAGCGGGGGGGGIVTTGTSGGTPSPSSTSSDESLSRITGYVYDAEGNPIGGVQVSILAEDIKVSGAKVNLKGITEASDITSENGLYVFNLPSKPKDGDRIVLRFLKPGYVDTHSVFRVAYNAVSDGELFLPVKLYDGRNRTVTSARAEITRTDGYIQIVEPQTVTDPASGMEVNKTTVPFDENTGEITFSVPSPEGNNTSAVEFTIGGAVSGGRTVARTLGYTGQVSSSMFYGDPTDEEALAAFPGEFTTSDGTGRSSSARAVYQATGDGAEGILVTAGFVQIKLEDQDGNEIESFPGGAEVGVSMRVPDGVYNPETGTTVQEGDDVPIFTYDEDAGEWRVEKNTDGTVKRGTVMRDEDGLYVPFTTPHLSWFNLDWKGDQCPDGQPEITALDSSGKALDEFTVEINKSSNIGWWSYGLSTTDGKVQFWRAPADIPWSIKVVAGNEESYPVKINNCEDVEVQLHRTGSIQANITAMCRGNHYKDVGIYAFLNGLKIAYGKTSSKGSASFSLPLWQRIQIYGTSTDECKDHATTYISTDTTASEGDIFNATIVFDNACCPNYIPPLHLSALAPDKDTVVAVGKEEYGDVAGLLTFSEAVKATSVPALYVTLRKGDTTVFESVPATSLGTVAWTDLSDSSARKLGLVIAKQQHLHPGTTYSFTISMTPPQFVSVSSGGSLALSDYLTSVPGVVAYSSTSVTGTFTTVDSDPNNLPVPGAGEDACAVTGSAFTLDASSSSDPDGDALTYSWALASGPGGAAITNADSAQASFTPSENGAYLFALTVDDGRGGRMRDLITVTARERLECRAHGDCDDGNEYTVDSCTGMETCDNKCVNEGTYCSIKLDKVNYEPGERMGITFTASNAGAEAAECGAVVRLKRDQDTIVWFSFDDDIFITIPPGERVQETKYYHVLDEWVETNSPDGSDYGIYPVKRDGTDWDKGDNFNILVRKCDASPCSANSECDDGIYYTTDTCVSPGTCSAYCDSTCEPACLNDTDCDDSDSATNDICVDFTSCDPTTACVHVPSACGSDSDCNDYDSITVDTCENPGTSSAQCVNTPICSVQCRSSLNCDDGNPNTIDSCNNPGTCEASCDSCISACGMDSQCDDGNSMTNDFCDFPGTCDSVCMNISCVSCTSGDDCPDDGNPDTYAVCENSGTCGSMCTYKEKAVKVAFAGDTRCRLLMGGTVQCYGTSAPSISAKATDITGGRELSWIQNFCMTLVNGSVSCARNWDFYSVSGVTNPLDISAGAGHSCAVLQDGSVKCWGVNDFGQLGNGATSSVSIYTPVQVSGITDAVQVSAGYRSTCAVTSAGAVKCWGYNYSGQLGDGTHINSLVPVEVLDIANAVEVATSGYSACAVLSDGKVKCWGYNIYGSLGSGSQLTTSATPVYVANVASAVSIAGISMDATAGETCIVSQTGTVACWGTGALGTNQTSNSDVPVKALGVSNAVGVAIGNDYACALINDGNQMCWGPGELPSLIDGM